MHIDKTFCYHLSINVLIYISQSNMSTIQVVSGAEWGQRRPPTFHTLFLQQRVFFNLCISKNQSVPQTAILGLLQ